LEEKGKKHWNLKCHFQVGGNEKEFRKSWKYISQNGTCYKKASEICVIENEYVL
jgi:hypothetical protein